MNMGGIPESVALFMFTIKFKQKRKLHCHLSFPSQVLGKSNVGGPGAVAYACNSSNVVGRGWRIVV
jgi:hypothetical protein